MHDRDRLVIRAMVELEGGVSIGRRDAAALVGSALAQALGATVPATGERVLRLVEEKRS